MVGGPFFDFSCYCIPLFSVSSSIVARGSFAFRFGFASPPLSSSATPSGPIVSNFRRSTLTNLHLAYRWYLPGLLDEPRQPMQNRLAILIGTGEWVRCNTTGGSCSERGTSDAQGELGLGLMGDLMNFAGAFAVGDTSSPLLRTWMVSSQADITGSTLFVLIVFFVNIPPSYTFPYFVLVPSHQYNVRRAHHNNTSLSISTWKPWALHQLINSALCHES